MALKGNLRDFTITQLLNLINLPRHMAFVSFREGKLAYSQLGKTENGLATILYRGKKISPTQHKLIKARAGNMSDKELGLLLINANYISQEDILASLENEFVGNLQRLFTWVEGLFRFEAGVMPPDEKITLRINLENIIIEGARSLRELEQLQDEIPSLDIALKFADRPGTNIKNVNLSVEEWRVVSYINPKNTIQQISNTAKLNDLEIRRIVYGLLQAGLVELIRPEGVKPPIRTITSLPPEKKEEQKSLVNRIIQRIRSL
jgi:hypothetical protein